MYNEDMVAERIIKPFVPDRLSAGRSKSRCWTTAPTTPPRSPARPCEEWAAKGYPIKYIHRDNRVGYKAGALAEGLKQANGEFIAIFDADFVPPRDILHNVVDYFTDDKIGMVQVRWDHLNRDASLLTKSQAIFLDGHFVIEHTARNRSGRFMHFNGTAGVWRRTTIDDAGGWQHDTLTEDLDLSYRCQLKGWQFVYLPQFCAPAELPPEMIALQAAGASLDQGLDADRASSCCRASCDPSICPMRIKTEAFFHLTNTIVYPLMVLLTLMMYPAFIYVDGPWKNWHVRASCCSASACSSWRPARPARSSSSRSANCSAKKPAWKSLIYLPMLMALGVGVCINNTKAVFEAIWVVDPPQAQRIRPHAEVRRDWNKTATRFRADERVHLQAPDGADHRDRVRRVHELLHLHQPVLQLRARQRPVPADLRRRISVRGGEFALRVTSNEPGSAARAGGGNRSARGAVVVVPVAWAPRPCTGRLSDECMGKAPMPR